jgi:hypothetical protein
MKNPPTGGVVLLFTWKIPFHREYLWAGLKSLMILVFKPFRFCKNISTLIGDKATML